MLDYLYSREYGRSRKSGRTGKAGVAGLTAYRAALADKDQDPFPAKHSGNHGASRAGEVSNDGALTDPEVLRRLEPNKELLKTIAQLKHMMKERGVHACA